MKTILTFVCFVPLVLMPVFSFAGIDLPWSTTFDCAECLEPSSCLCDVGVTDGPSWGYYCNNAGAPSSTTPNSNTAGIIAEANNPDGGGGKGARFWAGDGKDDLSGTLAITFNSVQPELYIRWYFKYPAGFTWTSGGIGYEKWLYIHTDQGTDCVPEPTGWDQINVYSSAPSPPGNNQAWAVTGGWDTIMAAGELVGGHRTGDGLWHWAEVHIKMDTNGSNGIAEMWTGGVKRFSFTNMNYGTKTGWKSLHFKSNQNTPSNGGCKAVYYDDMAIATTGPIGPLGNRIKPPTGLKIVQ